MKHHTLFVVGAILIFSVASASAAGQQPAPSSAAAAAVKANPELATGLSKELGSSPEQAAGAAGALFGLAKSRLAPEQFTQISRSVPGMNALLGAAPATGTGTGAAASVAQMAGAAGGLAGVGQSFSKLGLSPDMIAKAVPFLTQYVSKLGGPAVGKLLAGVLK
jgi:hypothetical protein